LAAFLRHDGASDEFPCKHEHDWEMRLVTRMETKTTDTRSTTLKRARCTSSTSCRCGQQLDLCVRDHCPRCGRSIR